MRNLLACLVSLFMMVSFTGQSSAQQSQVTPAASASAASPVPRLIRFNGALLDRQGQPLKGPVGVTFSLYAQQSGDAPLWMETQNVELDAKGNYTVLLGSHSAANLPEAFFLNGEARWLGVQPEREPELPRVLLVSVPYALKAADAETLGGLPPSAFLGGVSVQIGGTGGQVQTATDSVPASAQGPSPTTAISGTGTKGSIPLWTNSTTQGNSLLIQNGSAVEFPATGTATPLKGFNSNALDLLASAFKKGATTASNQLFRWQAEPVGNNTTTPSGKLNLLFASGAGIPAETGFSISNKGILSFAPGQPMPTVSGNETVTGNVSANQLQSNVATGTAPLVVKSTTQVLNLNASLLGGMPASAFATRGANAFSGFQSIAGNNLSMYIGDVGCPAGSVGIQAQAFSFGCSNFAMMLDTKGNTVINRPSGGFILFREGNGSDQVNITPGGTVGVQASLACGSASCTGNGIISTGAAADGPAGDGVVGSGGATTGSSPCCSLGGVGVRAFGGSAAASLGNGGVGVSARGGDAVLGGGGFGGFGIEAFGGKNGSGTMARAGEFHGDVEVTGCLSVSPNTNAHFQVGSCLSDMRLKKNIQPFPAALDKVAQLQPVTYDWRTEEYPQFRFSSGREIGLIAQEVEKEFPEMVSTDKAGYKRVNYGELPYLMLQAIRELKAEKDELQEEMKTKEAQWEERFRAQEQRVSLQEMQQQMAALEARLALVESRGGSIQASDATREIPKRSEGGGPLEAQARF